MDQLSGGSIAKVFFKKQWLSRAAAGARQTRLCQPGLPGISAPWRLACSYCPAVLSAPIAHLTLGLASGKPCVCVDTSEQFWGCGLHGSQELGAGPQLTALLLQMPTAVERWPWPEPTGISVAPSSPGPQLPSLLRLRPGCSPATSGSPGTGTGIPSGDCAALY